MSPVSAFVIAAGGGFDLLIVGMGRLSKFLSDRHQIPDPDRHPNQNYAIQLWERCPIAGGPRNAAKPVAIWTAEIPRRHRGGQGRVSNRYDGASVSNA